VLDDNDSDFITRLQIPVKLAAEAGVKQVYDHRLRIYRKFLDILENSKDKTEFEARRIADYELFCLSFKEAQYRVGNNMYIAAPMYPSITQTRMSNLVDNFKTNYFVLNRQVGKTTFAGTKGAQIFLRDAGSVQNFFAPRLSQLVMFEGVHEVLNHPHIIENYLKGGINNVQKIYSPTLKSKCEAKVLGAESQFRRGSSGIAWIDEMELVDEETKREVIEPLQASFETNTTLVYILTPKLSFDPHLGQEIAAAESDPLTGYLHSHMFQSALELRTSRDYIKQRFGDGPKGLKVPCMYGKQGHCPKYYRELYEEDPDLWDQFERWADFQCSEICKKTQKLLQEDWGEFPTGGGRYFPLEVIDGAASPFNFYHYGDINYNARHIVSCDWGLVVDPMVIQVWEMAPNRAPRLIYWEQSQKGAHQEIEQLDLLKKRFSQYRGDMLFVDTTADNTFLQRNLTRPHSSNERYRIPAGKIWSNETAQKNELYGIVVKGPFKSEMYGNWRRLLLEYKVEVPDKHHEPEFWDAWFEDHFSINAEEAHDGQYYKFGRTGHTVDAAAMAGLGISGLGIRRVHVGIS